MRKFVALLGITVIMLGTLCGCLVLNNTDKSTVLIIQFNEDSFFKTVQKSMENSIEELGYKNKIEFKKKNAKGDSKKLEKYFKNADKDETDLIIAVGTEAALTARNADIDIPVIFVDVPYPVENKIVTSFNITNENITGISSNIPTEKIFELAYTIDSNINSIALIYDFYDSTSLNDINKAKELCELVGIKYNTVLIDNLDDSINNTKNIIKDTDFIFIPYSAKGFELIPKLSQLAQVYGTPVYSNNMNMVKSGAFAAIEVNYNALGQQTAQMAVRILGGVKIKDANVESVKDYITYINCDTAEMLDIDIPVSLKNTYIPCFSD